MAVRRCCGVDRQRGAPAGSELGSTSPSSARFSSERSQTPLSRGVTDRSGLEQGELGRGAVAGVVGVVEGCAVKSGSQTPQSQEEKGGLWQFGAPAR